MHGSIWFKFHLPEVRPGLWRSMPYLAAFFGLSFRRPSRTRLSAVATIASSFDRGTQPSKRLAFSLVAFFTLPTSGRISFMAGSRSAAMRKSQSGSWRLGALLADEPSW